LNKVESHAYITCIVSSLGNLVEVNEVGYNLVRVCDKIYWLNFIEAFIIIRHNKDCD